MFQKQRCETDKWNFPIAPHWIDSFRNASIHYDTNESIHGVADESIQYETESILHDVDESIHQRDESIQSDWFCVFMADNVNALFPIYLPTGSLETHAKQIKYWFKLKTIMNNNQTHYYKKKTQLLLAIVNKRLQLALTCKE